jgi:hypothetical protein
MERNSEPFTLRNGKNSKSLLLFLFHCRKFRTFLCFTKWFGADSESFLFRRTAGIPPEQTNCSVYSVFRGIIFLSEIANPSKVTTHKEQGLGICNTLTQNQIPLSLDCGSGIRLFTLIRIQIWVLLLIKVLQISNY